jgi:hypothetical protein
VLSENITENARMRPTVNNGFIDFDVIQPSHLGYSFLARRTNDPGLGKIYKDVRG